MITKEESVNQTIIATTHLRLTEQAEVGLIVLHQDDSVTIGFETPPGGGDGREVAEITLPLALIVRLNREIGVAVAEKRREIEKQLAAMREGANG